nr:hypothetical protein [Geotalea toluenoxydans]
MAVIPEEEKLGEMEIGLESLISRFGIDKVADTVAQKSKEKR